MSIKETLLQLRIDELENAMRTTRSRIANFLEQLSIALDEDDYDEMRRLINEARGT